MFQWIIQQRDSKLPVSEKAIVIRAQQIAVKQGQEYKGSRGSLYRFMQQKSLTLSRTTSAWQKLSVDLSKICRFILYIQKKRLENNYALNAIYGGGIILLYLSYLYKYITHICDSLWQMRLAFGLTQSLE